MADYKKTIKEQAQALPDHYVSFISSSVSQNKIASILFKENNSEDTNNRLENEALMLLLGIQDYNGFIEALQTEFDFSEKEAHSAATKIDTQIYQPIVEKMKSDERSKVPRPPSQSSNNDLSEGSSFLQKRSGSMMRSGKHQKVSDAKKPGVSSPSGKQGRGGDQE